jgi:hypothetical protein
VLGQIPGLASVAGAKAAQLLKGGLGKVAAAQMQRGSKAIGALLTVGGKVAPAAPVVATKALSQLGFGPSSAPAPAPKKTKGAKTTDTPTKLATVYKARTDEIKAQTMYDATGRSVMRPEARMKMAEVFAPMRALDPIGADRAETIAARRIEYLANLIPRRPDAMAAQIGPDMWQPSDMKMRAWARAAVAVEDPMGVIERLSDGSITPEDAAAMRNVYPELYADIQRQIYERLPTLRATLPYQKRLALSIFSGLPVDAATNPRILAVLQAQYGAEPGTEGGTQAPTPQPQFGSVKAPAPTPSQAREAQEGAA